jgi:hypothetical protein
MHHAQEPASEHLAELRRGLVLEGNKKEEEEKSWSITYMSFETMSVRPQQKMLHTTYSGR